MNYLTQLNLFGKVVDIPYTILSENDPLGSTEARTGMVFLNTLKQTLFICIDDTSGTTKWLPVLGGTQLSDGGESGVGIMSITPVSVSEESGAVNIYTVNLTDGSAYPIQFYNGKEGYTPVKGEDYFTAEDRSAIIEEVVQSISPSEGITQETDPTVPDWAKADTKPTYTAAEVGALPDTTQIPAKTSELENDAGFITASDISETATVDEIRTYLNS